MSPLSMSKKSSRPSRMAMSVAGSVALVRHLTIARGNVALKEGLSSVDISVSTLDLVRIHYTYS